ncbi:MAG: hypothetical protein J6K55_04340 [Clostridia bacterium]|nr:hypothetical protein [Clostridia bacterium]
MELHSDQERIHLITGGFLRMDRTDDALWVSDYPRRNADTIGVEEQLRSIGVSCALDEKTKMWHLDWTEDRWDELIRGLPLTPPALPADDSLHPAYALCRFALLHPAPRTPESLCMLRSVLKGTQTIRQLHEEAVSAHRAGQPIAYDAGRLLAAQLMKGETKR